ncbi:MAG TPA: hypothetical protein DDX89_04040 [Candidatus Omnitrophica bacterium]|nr:hypothetical protein [Candidatus Omnitrophota bacterium]
MAQSPQHERMWAQLFESAPCGLLFLDRQGVIRYVNPAAAALLRVDVSQAVGQPLIALRPEWGETPLWGSLPSLLCGEPSEGPVSFDLPDGPQRMLKVSASVLVNGTSGSLDDGLLLAITESATLAGLEQRLQRSEYHASIGKLARGIAHELNSPLDGVLRYTHLALEQLTADAPVQEYLLHVKEGLDRMVRAVKAFLEFSRQVTTPVKRVANLNHLIEDALLLVQYRAKFQHIRVVKRLAPDLPAVLDGGLQHAVVNLVKNAFDAMPNEGTLTVTTSPGEGCVEVLIEDTGGGIPESVRERLFEPFFTTKPIHHGNGLGLTIAKEAVERSGGRMEFTSQPGAGTTFRIVVPVAPVEPTPNGSPSNPCGG